ncbi:MAG: MBL fold metallo-hydrolase [Nitrospirota bacterium]|nr:MBL fold metallo-hydrolase [Nitrospirota bacterium]
MRISFHGAAGCVTGSCHMVECGGIRLLVDCGLSQGRDDAPAADFGFDPAGVDFVLLTHAHLDHCGRLPLLAKMGFKGEVVTTAASRELARLVILDAAHLEEDAAQYRERQAARRTGVREPVEPLYSMLDALQCMDAFGRTARYGERMQLAPGVAATFLDAGHILGSAVVLLELTEGGDTRTVLFSGDLGSDGRPLIRDPAPPPPADVVVMESTYGDRLHRPLEDSVEELYAAIAATFRQGGNVFIPTFALERAQELLYFLREGVERGRISPATQVFLDSPMAISATRIYQHHPDCFDREARNLLATGTDPFRLPGLHFCRGRDESMQINRVQGGAIVMAGAGMCNGGRIVHHLKHNLWRREAGIIFVSYAAEDTLARAIIDGATEVEILGETIPVAAAIHTINGFSAHADQAELLAWHGRIQGATRTFLVHGEPAGMEQLAARLRATGTRVHLPDMHQGFELLDP